MHHLLHPRNIVSAKYKTSLPPEIVIHISRFLHILDRMTHIGPAFEKTVISQLTECRDDDTHLANSYTKYYNTITGENKILLSSWICEHHNKNMIEYRTDNKYFSTTIGIINENDENDDEDVMVERFIYIQLLFHNNRLLFMKKERRLAFLRLFKTFQSYGFDIETESTNHVPSDFIYISKVVPLKYSDLLDTNISGIARQHSTNACFSLLLDMHNDVFNVIKI